MDEVIKIDKVPKICPQCHIEVRSTDYFCFNCGKALREKPKPIGIVSQIILYAGCLLLPPLGFWWGYKYLKQDGEKAKMVGIICIVLTALALVALFAVTKNISDTINEQINSTTSTLMGF